MRVVFLDVDGVLNYTGCREKINGYLGVEDACAERLAKIVTSVSPPAAIVLTSSWKELWNHQPKGSSKLDPMAQYLVDKLMKQGLHITDRTEEKDSLRRGLGIQGWIKKVGSIESWVVLDDEIFGDYDDRGIMPHLVKTDDRDGLTDADVEEAIKILRGE